MTALYARIGRVQRERGGLVVEAELAGDAAVVGALERACGASLAEMGHEEEAGRLLSAVERGGRIILHALVTGARAAAMTVERVYKGLECQISLLGNEISEISLVDRPLNKFSGVAPQKIAVLYKRSGVEMSITSAMNKYYGTKKVTDAEVDAAWEKMSPNERTIIEIKAARREAVGGRNLFPWLIARAAAGGGNPSR